MDNQTVINTTGEPVTEQVPAVDTPSTTVLLGACHQSTDAWDIGENLLCDRLKSGIEMCVALVVKNDDVELQFIGLDGKARYKVTWSDEPQTARQVIEYYRPDLLSDYDKHNPTGKYEPYKGGLEQWITEL